MKDIFMKRLASCDHSTSAAPSEQLIDSSCDSPPPPSLLPCSESVPSTSSNSPPLPSWFAPSEPIPGMSCDSLPPPSSFSPSELILWASRDTPIPVIVCSPGSLLECSLHLYLSDSDLSEIKQWSEETSCASSPVPSLASTDLANVMHIAKHQSLFDNISTEPVVTFAIDTIQITSSMLSDLISCYHVLIVEVLLQPT